MSRKLVLISGGENGRTLQNGTYAPYETEVFDREAFRLTNKVNPNFLFVGTALQECEIEYFNTMKHIYADKLFCNCDILKTSDLSNKRLVEKLLSWADIIYVGGGDTEKLISIWKTTGFDSRLLQEINTGKVYVGISAGAAVWFTSCNSDVSSGTFKSVNCLNIFKAHFTPHLDEQGRYTACKEQLKENRLLGIMMPNRTALEIIDDEYRILLENQTKKSLVGYYNLCDEYNEKEMTKANVFQNLKTLFNRED